MESYLFEVFILRYFMLFRTTYQLPTKATIMLRRVYAPIPVIPWVSNKGFVL